MLFKIQCLQVCACVSNKDLFATAKDNFLEHFVIHFHTPVYSLQVVWPAVFLKSWRASPHQCSLLQGFHLWKLRRWPLPVQNSHVGWYQKWFQHTYVIACPFLALCPCWPCRTGPHFLIVVCDSVSLETLILAIIILMIIVPWMLTICQKLRYHFAYIASFKPPSIMKSKYYFLHCSLNRGGRVKSRNKFR